MSKKERVNSIVDISNKLQFADDLKAIINGVELTKDDIEEVYYARIYRTAGVLKNTRERGATSKKFVIEWNLKNDKIDALTAFELLKDTKANESKIKELAKNLPKVEKTDEPTKDDILTALEMVASGGGQAQ